MPESIEHQNTEKVRKGTENWTVWRPAEPVPTPRPKETSKSTSLAEWVVQNIVDSVIEFITVHPPSTTKLMKPVSPSPPEQERHTIQYPATQSTSTNRTSTIEQVQKNTNPVQNHVPVQSRSTPTITRGKPIIKTAVLNPELKPKTSTIPELIRLQEKKTDSDKK